jgi:hypothetical protein
MQHRRVALYEQELPLLLHTSAYVSIRQHTADACSIGELRSMNKSFRSSCIRQHTSYVSIRQHTPRTRASAPPGALAAYVSIRHTSASTLLQHTRLSQYTAAYVSIRHVYGSIREHTPLVPGALRSSIRQQTSVYASIRQHTPRMLTNVRPERRRHTREQSAEHTPRMLTNSECRT